MQRKKGQKIQKKVKYIKNFKKIRWIPPKQTTHEMDRTRIKKSVKAPLVVILIDAYQKCSQVKNLLKENGQVNVPIKNKVCLILDFSCQPLF